MSGAVIRIGSTAQRCLAMVSSIALWPMPNILRTCYLLLLIGNCGDTRTSSNADDFLLGLCLIDQHQSRILSVSADCKLSLWIFDTASLAVVKSKVFEICSKTSDSIVSLVACRQDSSWTALVTRSSAQVRLKMLLAPRTIPS